MFGLQQHTEHFKPIIGTVMGLGTGVVKSAELFSKNSELNADHILSAIITTTICTIIGILVHSIWHWIKGKIWKK